MGYDAPMKLQSLDTPAEVERLLIEGYRRMSPRDKLERVRQLNHGVQQMALARIRQKYPGASEREHQLRLASLWLTRELMVEAFGWDPEIEGY